MALSHGLQTSLQQLGLSQKLGIRDFIENTTIVVVVVVVVRHRTALPHQLWETSLVTYLGCVRSMKVADRREHGWG